MSNREWYSTEQAARKLMMTSEWVRQQINAGRLVATFYLVDGRRTFRIHRDDLERFIARYRRKTGGGE